MIVAFNFRKNKNPKITMKNYFCPCIKLITLALSLCYISVANASTISYEVFNISGNTWEYTYSVTNDTLAVDIEEFSIFFDYNLYENLTSSSTPTGWDPIVFQPDNSLPDDGLYDALALSVLGIAPGDTLGGFSVQFDYLGSTTPGSQIFEIVDPNTFAALDSGSTNLATSNNVPEPNNILLLIIGMLVIVYQQRKSVSRLQG